MAAHGDVDSSAGSSPPSESQPKGITHSFDVEDGDEGVHDGLPGHTSNDQRDMGRMGKTQELRVGDAILLQSFLLTM